MWSVNFSGMQEILFCSTCNNIDVTPICKFKSNSKGTKWLTKEAFLKYFLSSFMHKYVCVWLCAWLDFVVPYTNTYKNYLAANWDVHELHLLNTLTLKLRISPVYWKEITTIFLNLRTNAAMHSPLAFSSECMTHNKTPIGIAEILKSMKTWLPDQHADHEL